MKVLTLSLNCLRKGPIHLVCIPYSLGRNLASVQRSRLLSAVMPGPSPPNRILCLYNCSHILWTAVNDSAFTKIHHRTSFISLDWTIVSLSCIENFRSIRKKVRLGIFHLIINGYRNYSILYSSLVFTIHLETLTCFYNVRSILRRGWV